ncbi:hypothetical protein ACVIU4_007946 [Bradyrhizobium barranii subsp. barranii]
MQMSSPGAIATSRPLAASNASPPDPSEIETSAKSIRPTLFVPISATRTVHRTTFGLRQGIRSRPAVVSSQLDPMPSKPMISMPTMMSA